MRGPKDLVPELSDEERVKVKEIVDEIEVALQRPGHEAQIQTNGDRSTREVVWEAVAEEARKAGWDVDFRGAMLKIERPRNR